jgi:hypothetical protein
MISIRVKDFLIARPAIERFFGQPLPLKTALLFDSVAEAFFDALQENQVLRRQLEIKYGLTRKGDEKAKDRKIRVDRMNADLEAFKESFIKHDHDAVPVSKLGDLKVSAFDLAILRKFGIVE